MRGEATVPDEDPSHAWFAVFSFRELSELLKEQLRAAADREAPRGDGAAGGGDEVGGKMNIYYVRPREIMPVIINKHLKINSI